MVSSNIFGKPRYCSKTEIDLILNSRGRYYASRALKIIIAHLIQYFDIKTDVNANPKTQKFYWRSAIVPKSNTVIQLRKRVK